MSDSLKNKFFSSVRNGAPVAGSGEIFKHLVRLAFKNRRKIRIGKKSCSRVGDGVYFILWTMFRRCLKPVPLHFCFSEVPDFKGKYWYENQIVKTCHAWVCKDHDCIASEVTKVDERLFKLSGMVKKWTFLLEWYCDHIPPSASRLVRAVLSRLPDKDRCEVETIEYLSYVSDIIKKEFPSSLDGSGRYLVDMKVMGGYSTHLNTIDPVKPWFYDLLSKRESLPSYQLQELKKFIDVVVAEIGHKEKNIPIEEYVRNRGYWDGSGSALGESFSVVVNGRKVALRSKSAAMLKYTDAEIVKKVVEGRSIVSATFQKMDEAVKARIVQNVSVESHIRVSYANEFLGNLPDWTPLEKSGASVVEFWSQLSSERGWGLALDFSGFDKNIRSEVFTYVVESLFKQAVLGGADERVLDAELGSSVKSTAKSPGFSGETEGWMGLPSGHRWTALAGTIINRAVSEYVRDKIGVTWQSWHQGDDIAIFSDSKLDLKEICPIFEHLGMEVNPHKTVEYFGGVEFLRNWAKGGRTYAYPARLVRNMMWSKPGSGLVFDSWLNRMRDSGDSISRAQGWGFRGLMSYARYRFSIEVPKYLGEVDKCRLKQWFFASKTEFGAGGGIGFSNWEPRLLSYSGPIHIKSSKVDGLRLVRLRQLLRDEVPLAGAKAELVFERVKERGRFWDGVSAARPVPLMPGKNDPEWWSKQVMAGYVGYLPEYISRAAMLLKWPANGLEIPRDYISCIQDTLLPDLSFLQDKVTSMLAAHLSKQWHGGRERDIYFSNQSNSLPISRDKKIEKLENKYSKNRGLWATFVASVIYA